DIDHYGALGEIHEKYPGIVTMSSELDAPYIDGRKKSLRATRAMGILAAARPAPIDRTLAPREIMPWCGGTEIIPTPGHMPGHISLFVRRHRAVITGDALISIRGRLHAAHPRYALNPGEARASARLLLELDAERYICYHGGTVIRGISGNKTNN
ncbi:MAG: MBL fold metallo-hydrolase, partial [Synergistaceae bacterium]|nr:MBL fold metallo-hydrolase [Synergistaceae bacterium]